MSDYITQMDNRASSEPVYTPDLFESFSIGFASDRRENLPIASRMIHGSEPDSFGKRMIFEAVQRGDIKESTANSFYNIAGNYKTRDALTYFKDDVGYDIQEYDEELKDWYARKRSEDEKRLSLQGGMGSAFEFGGRIAAAFTDPLYLVTAPLGIGNATTIVAAGLRTAALNGVIEAAAIPFIWGFKQEIGAQYGMSDMAMHLGVAVGAGGILGGGLKGLQKLMKPSEWKLFKDAVDTLPKTADEADNMVGRANKMAQEMDAKAEPKISKKFEQSAQGKYVENLYQAYERRLAAGKVSPDMWGASYDSPGTGSRRRPPADRSAADDYTRQMYGERVSKTDLDSLEIRQDRDRIAELQAKTKFKTALELDELEMLQKKVKDIDTADMVVREKKLAVERQKELEGKKNLTPEESGELEMLRMKPEPEMDVDPTVKNIIESGEEIKSFTYLRQIDEHKKAVENIIDEGVC